MATPSAAFRRRSSSTVRPPCRIRPLANLDGADVAGYGEGRRRVIAVVRRRSSSAPTLAHRTSSRRLVVDLASPASSRRALPRRLLEGGEVDEWLEVEPGCRRVWTARLNCDWLYERPPTMRGLRRCADRPPPARPARRVSPLAALARFVHRARAPPYRILRGPLQVEVERGVDVERRRAGGDAREVARPAPADVVDEVRRFIVERPATTCWARAGRSRPRRGDVFRIRPSRAAPHCGALARVPRWRTAMRRRELDDAGDQRGFGQREVA